MGGGHMGGPHMFGPSVGRTHMGGHFHDGRFHDGRFHHRRNVFFFAPAFGYDDYGYGYSCYWLRRNALATGSPYWWSRYDACVYGGY
jgi:hypothetical protein